MYCQNTWKGYSVTMYDFVKDDENPFSGMSAMSHD